MSKKTTYGRSSKKPTVGRKDDPQWVASTTYCGFLNGGIEGYCITLRSVKR